MIIRPFPIVISVHPHTSTPRTLNPQIPSPSLPQSTVSIVASCGSALILNLGHCIPRALLGELLQSSPLLIDFLHFISRGSLTASPGHQVLGPLHGHWAIWRVVKSVIKVTIWTLSRHDRRTPSKRRRNAPAPPSVHYQLITLTDGLRVHNQLVKPVHPHTFPFSRSLSSLSTIPHLW